MGVQPAHLEQHGRKQDISVQMQALVDMEAGRIGRFSSESFWFSLQRIRGKGRHKGGGGTRGSKREENM